ncbi:translocation protein TolB [Leptospira perolatii]|uniref:Translocation protein TolB n=1 Tax=Leptospira perolatii TaxID=2023191 RepID=A0A2M9ZNL7_9LEPT|nr:translocation protein TolB [Leptospira perolatii]PJZ73678.1 translocation protein TolB [Leptospira perolatii]
MTFLAILNCASLFNANRIKPIQFDYGPISQNYFRPGHEKPFPLTVQRGNNLYHSTTKDGRYLFYTTGQKGNFDIWFRDLKSPVVVPVTSHPASEMKPAISPDGTKLVFVSEQFDSSGDLILLKMNPEEWASKILEGKRFLSEDFKNLTNLNAEIPEKSDRFVDTDPCWSPDNRHLVFSSDRLTPGTPNLVLLDTDGKEAMRLLTKQGGASPYWSENGKSIVFLSYFESSAGEIYSLDLSTNRINRITKDAYLDFSPSLSSDGKTLYYTSIRSDSDKNGVLEERDNSFIVRVDLGTNKEKLITSGNSSIFDTKYSRFNGGSIVFTASFYGTMNVYFLPATGFVPKVADISSQFQLALQYKEKHSFEDFLIALDSIEFYFSEDPLFPVFRAKALREKFSESLNLEKKSVNEETRKEINTLRLHPKWGLAYAYLLQAEGSKSMSLSEYKSIWSNFPNLDRQSLAALNEEIGIQLEKSGDKSGAIQVYERILSSFPEYYHAKEVLRREGTLLFLDSEKSNWILPEPLIKVANDQNLGKEELRNLYEVLEEVTLNKRSNAEKISIADTAEKVNSLKTKSPRLSKYFSFLKSSGLIGTGDFAGSILILDEILTNLSPGDPLFLKCHLLKSEAFRGIGKTRESLTELKTFLENYDIASGVSIDEREMERSFLHFENLAKNYESRKDYFQASLHYFYNAENMFTAKSRNLFQETLYKDFAVYYQRLMVDSVFRLAKSMAEENAKGVLGVLDPTSFDPLSGKEGLKLLTKYYEEHHAADRAREYLDLATLYGYAYFLINRSVIRETYYYSAGTMNSVKKEAILRDYKQAEYELRWIIFSDPTYHDAYQLLGWLYQYVDIIKSRRQNLDEPSDEEAFESIYKKYFPEKNFEENVELYSQILELLGESFPNKKALSDLRLNLGNNYFLLKNYPKADEQYGTVESYSKFILSKSQFEDYRQKATFLFNSARSSIYMAKYNEAVRKLKEAAELYSKNEFQKLYSENNPKEFVESYHEKLALIYTLTGLSFMESGNFQAAIPYYQDAIRLNEFSKLVDPVNLYNALGICYHRLKKLSESEKALEKAEILVSEKGIGWLPKKVKLSVWDLFWDFIFDIALPDSTRISGAGRFPEAIPTPFQPLLSSGVRVNNLLLEQNYQEAAKEIEVRLDYVNTKSLSKTFAGKLIRSQSLGDLGYLRYRRHEYSGAKSAFIEAENFEKSVDGLESKGKQTFRKYLYSLFAELESENSGGNQRSIDEITDSYERLSSAKRENINLCLNTLEGEDKYILRKRCESEFYKQNYDYDVLLANLLYYLGEANLKEGEFVLGVEKLGRAASLLENPSNLPQEIIGLSKDPFPRKERVLHALSRTSIYLRLGDLQKATENLNTAEEIANEFYYGLELIQAWILQARMELSNGNLAKAKNRLSKAENLLENQAHIVSEAKGFLLRDLYETKIRIDLESENLQEAFRTWDKYRSVVLFRNFLRGAWSWEGEEAQQEYALFESAWYDYRQAYLRFQSSLEFRADSKKYEAELEKNTKLAKGSLLSLYDKIPERAAFLRPFQIEQEETLEKGEVEVRLLMNQGKIHLRLRTPSGFKTAKLPNQMESLKDYLLNEPDWQNAASQILDPGNTQFAIQLSAVFPKLILKSDTKTTISNRPYATKTFASYTSAPSNYNLKFRNISADRLKVRLEDSDVLISEFPESESDFIFGEKSPARLDLKETFANNHRISTVVLLSDTLPSWKKISQVASALLGSGIRRVYVCPNSKNCFTEALKEIKGSAFTSLDGGLRFGKISALKNIPQIKRILTLSREEEIRGNIQNSHDLLAEARAVSGVNSEDAQEVEENNLRLLRKLHPEIGLSELYDLSYEDRTEKQKENLAFALCLSTLLDHSENDCSELPAEINLKEKWTNLLISISALKRGIDPGSSLEAELPEGDRFYDPFLYRIRLIDILLEVYRPEEVKKQIAIARRQANTQDKFNLLKKKEIELRNHVSMMDEIGEVESGRLDSGPNLGKESQIESDRLEEGFEYKNKIKLLASGKEQGRRISPVSLYSEVFGASSDLFNSISLFERSIIVDLLRYSLGEEQNKEMENFLNAFLDFERKKQNLPRAKKLCMEVGRAYFSRGNYSAAKQWLKLAEEQEPQVFKSELDFLKYKLDSINVGARSDSPASLSDWGSYSKFYKEAFKSEPKQFLEIVNRWVSSRKALAFSNRERREFSDFLNFLQTRAFKKNDSETFFDLGIAKSKLSLYRRVVQGSDISYSDLPVFRSVAFRLEEKLPEGQELLAVQDLGLTTLYLKFTKGKSNGELAYKDNRILKSSIFAYLGEAEKGGSEALLREALESDYRHKIKLSSKKLTYLYLESYHFLVPIIPRSDEEVYYITDPEDLLQNPVHHQKEEFLPGFGIKKKDTPNSPEWYKQLLKLEDLEIADGIAGRPELTPFHLLRVPLELDESKRIRFGGETLPKKVSRWGKGIWMLCSSFLEEFSYGSENLRDSLSYLQKEVQGPGVVNLGYQPDTHNSRFIKELTRRDQTRIPLKIRFQKAIEVMREAYPFDKYWNGYRLFTNSMILP